MLTSPSVVYYRDTRRDCPLELLDEHVSASCSTAYWVQHETGSSSSFCFNVKVLYSVECKGISLTHISPHVLWQSPTQ